MTNYDKAEIKAKLTLDMVFDVVHDFGGEPRITDFGFVSSTICHNEPGEGSHKLYYYDNGENGGLFKCYTGCDATFDIFELITKIQSRRQEWDLNDSVRWIATRFNFAPQEILSDKTELGDWQIFNKYDKIKIAKNIQNTLLTEYNSKLLDHLSYPIISDWEQEGISREVMRANKIGYYPTDEQITIPHFDADGRFIGLRGRALGGDEADKWGKYRPVKIGNTLYSHPLGMNLYNFNNSKPNIQKTKMAIVYEAEKSCLMTASYFGRENDISVAVCGSSISNYQMNLLLDTGVQEIVIAFDRQYQKLYDDDYYKWVKHLKSINDRYGMFVKISYIIDRDNLLPYKASPIDEGKKVFLQLYERRITI